MHKKIVYRLKNADAFDWMFALLFLTVGIALSSFVYSVIREESEPWRALTFSTPSRVVSASGVAPQIENLPTPAVFVGDSVPFRIERYIDCAVYTCPSGGIPVDVKTSWVQVNTNGDTLAVIPYPAGQLVTTLTEGEDYVVGGLKPTNINAGPAEFPDRVLKHIDKIDSAVSAWRIEGTVTPLVPNGQAAVWATEVFHVQHEKPIQAGEGPGE